MEDKKEFIKKLKEFVDHQYQHYLKVSCDDMVYGDGACDAIMVIQEFISKNE